MKTFYVYILTNKYRTTFYIGITNNLAVRYLAHIEKKGSIFTSKYNLNSLVYYEEFTSSTEAIAREKQLKNWKREWKIDLIKTINPSLQDLDIF